jgi:pimeloyl-ACP methyl ester carboxylesterase
MIPKEHSDLLVEGLGGEDGGSVRYVVVPGAGHMVTLEAPDEVSRALTDLLRQVVAARTSRTGG